MMIEGRIQNDARRKKLNSLGHPKLFPHPSLVWLMLSPL